MNEPVQDVLHTLLVATITGAVGIMVRLVQTYFKQLEQQLTVEIGQQQYEQVKQVAQTLIRAADQYREHLGWNGEQAKAFVKTRLLLAADEADIALSEAAIDALIEGVLNEIRDQRLSTGNTVVVNSHTLEPA